MFEKLREIIAKRIATHPEYDYGITKCWEEAMELVKENPEEVLSFIINDATDEEVYWFSEKLCDIYDLGRDERFVQAFKNRANRITDAEMRRSILQEIDYI